METIINQESVDQGIKQESWEPTMDQGEPTYWLSYEYKQM